MTMRFWGAPVASLMHFTVYFFQNQSLSARYLILEGHVFNLNFMTHPKVKTVAIITDDVAPLQQITVHVREHHSSVSLRPSFNFDLQGYVLL